MSVYGSRLSAEIGDCHSAFDDGGSVMLYDVRSGEFCFSKKYDPHIIGRMGGGSRGFRGSVL